jgi:flagellar assembly protein FliH
MSLSADVFEFDQLFGAAAAGAAATAVERAGEIVAQAHAQADAIADEARRRGHEEGFAAGLADAAATVAPAVEALAAAAAGVEAERAEYLARAERHAVELALQIAEKVVGATLAADADAVLSVVAGALRRTAERDHLVINVHPDDFEVVRASAGDIADRLGGVGRLEVVSERRVSRGGCLVRTQEAEIDAGIDRQIARVRELFAAILRGDEGLDG